MNSNPEIEIFDLAPVDGPLPLKNILQFNMDYHNKIVFHRVVFSQKDWIIPYGDSLIAIWHIKPKMSVTPTHMINFDINDPYDTDTKYKYE